MTRKNVRTLVTTWTSPASRTAAETFARQRITRHSVAASTNFATLVAIVTRWARRLAGVTVIARLTFAPPVLARQHHQRAHLAFIIFSNRQRQ